MKVISFYLETTVLQTKLSSTQTNSLVVNIVDGKDVNVTLTLRGDDVVAVMEQVRRLAEKKVFALGNAEPQQ